jgi:CoA:oxalate CoA-transferase
VSDAAPFPRFEGPLSGVVVVDLTRHVAGPACTRLLAVSGATVIKVEEPRRGDPMRWIGPFAGDQPGADRSLGFLDLNAGKLGVTLDLGTASGRALLLELVDRADLLVESFSPGVMASWGLSWEVLRQRRPRLVITSITSFGQDGPYRDIRATEIVLYAMGHAMNAGGGAQSPPLALAPMVALRTAGATAMLGTVAALFAARVNGEGDHVDVSIMETFLASIDRRADSLVAYAYNGETTTRESLARRRIPPLYNRCADGWFQLGVRNLRSWRRLLALLGPRWTAAFGDRYPLPEGPLAVDFDLRWTEWCSNHGKAEIAAMLQDIGVSCAPLNDVGDLLDDPHLRERGFFCELAHPLAGAARYAGVPFRMSATPGGLQRPAPLLGADNALVLGALGHSSDDLLALASAGVV